MEERTPMKEKIDRLKSSIPKKNFRDSLTQYDCPDCKDSGWIIKRDADGTELAYPCKCYQKHIINNKIKFANIPESFANIRLSSFRGDYYRDRKKINEINKIITYYLDNIQEMKSDGMGLFLYSETKGSGKTRMAASLANELIHEYDMSVRFATSLDIVSEIRASWDKQSEVENEIKLIRYLTTTEVLIIDDFGIEKRDDKQTWIDDKLYQIINKRYMDKNITIFTSNYPLEELKYDQRIINRVKERVYQVHFPEESVRDGIANARQLKMEKAIKGDNG